MADHLILLQPSANRVYAGDNARLSAAELMIMLGGEAGSAAVEPVQLAGVDYLRLDLAELDDTASAAVARLSSRLAVFRRTGEHLTPVEVPTATVFDEDLLTIPKYPGKTNEQFTRLLLNVTLASLRRSRAPEGVVLDPLCGRGTTCSAALSLGWNAAGVESDPKAVEAYATFLRTYLRRKRLKHHVDTTPVRREGKVIGRRLDVAVTPGPGGPDRSIAVITGDARDSAVLWGKRRFDAIVTDAPYGVVHASRTGRSSERSAATLLSDCLPVWAGQLKTGGVLGLSWNTLAMTREALVELCRSSGLEPQDSGPYRSLAHRVDSSIHRDVLVAVPA